MGYFLIAGVAASIALGVSYVLLRLARRFEWHPEIRPPGCSPNPTPRIGGIAVFAGMLAGVLVASQLGYFDDVFLSPRAIIAVFIAAAIVLVLGVMDDIFDLDWLTKLSGQFLAAGVVAWQGVQIVSLPIGGLTLFSPTLSLLLTVLAVVVVMNAVNFIDGLDGLVVGVALISNGVFFLYSFVLSLGDQGAPYFGLGDAYYRLAGGCTPGILAPELEPCQVVLGRFRSPVSGADDVSECYFRHRANRPRRAQSHPATACLPAGNFALGGADRSPS